MAVSDKSSRSVSKTETSSPRRKFFLSLVICVLTIAVQVSCNRLVTPPAKQVLKDAETKAREGEFLQAISLYESALEDRANAAEVHYRLAVLYDDKMSDPFNAMHHLKRYLTIAPNGPHAAEVKNFMKRDELTLVTQLSGDSIVSRADAGRLKNENLALRKQIEDQRAVALTKEKHPAVSGDKSAAPGKSAKKSPRTYVVQPGDTLASISRKFYKNSSGWKKIRNEDGRKIDHPAKLKPGETVTIP